MKRKLSFLFLSALTIPFFMVSCSDDKEEQEASKLTELMTGVVESGTGSALSGRGYTAAGKTGTAEHGDASSTTPHAWFVGFSNVEDPDIVVSVIAEESGSGSEVAVPIAQKIFDAYYNN